MKASALVATFFFALVAVRPAICAQARRYYLRAASPKKVGVIQNKVAIQSAVINSRAASQAKAKGTISQIVTMLEEMLAKSKETTKEETELYAKFKCYCDDETKEKEASIEEKTEEIGLLGSKIAELKASTGKLSAELAGLKAEMDDNEQMQETAVSVREKEATAFTEEKEMLETSTSQLGQAIDVLSAIGADQNLAESAEHEQFMAGFESKGGASSLMKLKTSVSKALKAATAFVDPAQLQKVKSFLQAPFTGAYAAQSGEIVGILKTMKDTFEANLDAAIKAEDAAIAAHGQFMETKQAEYDELSSSYDEKQALAGANDQELATKKTQYEEAVQAKTDAESFLAQLLPMCKTKATEFQERTMFRVNQEAAISKAIAILNSDAAFKTFGTVDATSTGATSLLQLTSKPRAAVQQLLTKAAKGKRDSRVGRIARMVRDGNPFTKVLDAITKMTEMIEEEAKADADQKSWCEKERGDHDAMIQEKVSEIDALNTEITDLDNTINSPSDGLKAQISEKETSLVQNSEAQAEETKIRRSENGLYQEDIGNLVGASGLLKKAIKVLEAFYAAAEKHTMPEFLQARRQGKEEPEGPETWDEPIKPSSAGKEVIDMLTFVLTETQKEETAAHKAEEQAQGLYEESMTTLKQEATDLIESLAELKMLLASTEKSLSLARADHEKTEAAKLTIERYLESIKPGCDFITDNFDARETARAEEKSALEQAVQLLKGSPGFTSAETLSLHEEWGACKETCIKDATHVECKACLSKVTVPGYCAGHPSTAGC